MYENFTGPPMKYVVFPISWKEIENYTEYKEINGYDSNQRLVADIKQIDDHNFSCWVYDNMPPTRLGTFNGYEYAKKAALDYLASQCEWV